MIMAVYQELVENKKIVMKWRMKDWAAKEGAEPDAMDLDPADAANCFSDVTIEFEALSDGECALNLTQTAVPEYDRFGKFVHIPNLEGGWKQMIFERIQQVFGYPLKK